MSPNFSTKPQCLDSHRLLIPPSCARPWSWGECGRLQLPPHPPKSQSRCDRSWVKVWACLFWPIASRDLLLLGEALFSPVDDNAAPVLEIVDFFHFATRLLDCPLYTSFSSRLLWKCICPRLGSLHSVMLVTKVPSSASKIFIIIIIIFISQPTIFIGRAIGLCMWVSITWKYYQ